MAQPKYTIYKYARLKDGSWRYCRAALYANHTIKADVVIVGRREEKHPEGNYYLACGGKWIPAGPDALTAQRQRHALLSGNALEYEVYSGGSVSKAAAIQHQGTVASGRKKVKDEISKYLDSMVASKRPGKSVRMNRNFLNAFANLIGKEYADEYNRDDVIKFRNHLLDKGYERKAEQGKLSDAIQSFEKCLTLKPDEFYATYNLGNAYYALKEYDRAAANYEKAYAQKPDYPETLVGLDASQLAANKVDAAIATYQRLVPMKPEDANIRFNFGTALFNAGKYQDAAAQYREAVRLNPAFAHAHYNLGMALLRLNDSKSAQAEFTEAHRLDPSLNPPVAAK